MIYFPFYKSRRLFFVACVFSMSLASGSVAFAASSALQTAGIGITPAIQNIALNTEQLSVNYPITITNNSAEPVTVNASAVDFTTYGTSNGIQFLASSQTDPHGLASHIILKSDNFTLEPHGSYQEVVSIQNTNSLAGGGHYASIVFGIGAQSVIGKQLTFSQSVASLIFVSTDGRGNYSLSLEKPKTIVALTSFPSTFSLLFSNTGNVQVTPEGDINVTDPFSQQIERAILNPNSGLVLPGTQRLMETAATQIKQPFWPGYYNVQVNYRYVGASKYSTEISKILYINVYQIAAAGLLVIIVFTVLKRFILPIKNRSR